MYERPRFGDVPQKSPVIESFSDLPLWSQPDEQVIYERGSIHEALAPYVDFEALRLLAAAGQDIRLAFRLNGGFPPPELAPVIDMLKVLLKPPEYIQIKSPADIAGFLMLDMGFLDQEQFRVCSLNTKNHLIDVHTVYQGTLNSSMVRIAEVLKRPLAIGAAAIIWVHNHPSGIPDPSPEDVLVSREIASAARLFDLDPLDPLIIGQGRWLSMKEKGGAGL